MKDVNYRDINICGGDFTAVEEESNDEYKKWEIENISKLCKSVRYE